MYVQLTLNSQCINSSKRNVPVNASSSSSTLLTCVHQWETVNECPLTGYLKIYAIHRKPMNVCWFTGNLCIYTHLHILQLYWKMQQEEQMLKWSISAILTGLPHCYLPYLSTITKILSCIMQLYNRMTTQAIALTQSCDLEWTSRASISESNHRLQPCLASYHVWNKSVHKHPNKGPF